LSHNGASDAQASVYLWVGVAIGIYVRAQVCKPATSSKVKIFCVMYALQDCLAIWGILKRHLKSWSVLCCE